MAIRRLVLDANILIRAVLGRRVKRVITAYIVDAEFFVPEDAYYDAERYLPKLLTEHARAEEVETALAYLTQLREVLALVPESVYLNKKADALARIGMRDPTDWPILATAIVFNCPIWTEDKDFFGTGVPTWTTDRVEIYLKESD